MKSLAWLFWGGVLATIFGVLWLVVHIPYFTEGIAVEGRVVRLENMAIRRHGWNRPRTRLTFEYRAGERKLTHRGETVQNDNYKIGDRVSMVYLPGHPESVIVTDIHHFWRVPFLMLGGGLFAMILALIIAYLYRLDWNSSPAVREPEVCPE